MAAQTSTKVDTYFFLCNPDQYYPPLGIYNEQLPELIKSELAQGEYFFTTWSCANSKSIQVGDKAYLLRSGSSPTGVIAAGEVIEAPLDQQLRNRDPKYSDLSATYINHYDNSYFVCLALNSVVDIDYPLEQKNLKFKPSFQGVNFLFSGSGKRFAPDHPAAVQALASEWESHSLIMQNRGHGCRLVDVFMERGDKAKNEKDYAVAISFYQQALEIEPNYSKALNRIKACESALGRASKQPSSASPIIVPFSPPQPKPIVQTVQEDLNRVREELDREEIPASSDANEARKRTLVEIARRQGQTKFRQTLLDAYDYKCAITGFDASEALEAAHIIPYSETENNDPANGILLRADLHTLFDLNLLVIDPETMQVLLCPSLRDTEYRNLHKKQVQIPAQANLCPSPQLLRQKLEQCDWLIR